MRIEYRNGRIRLPGSDTSWRPAEFVSLRRAPAEREYVNRLLLYSVEAAVAERAEVIDDHVVVPMSTEWFTLDEDAHLVELVEIASEAKPPSPALNRRLRKIKTQFVEAATAAAGEGRLTLGTELTRVSRIDGLRSADVPDIVAFGAWCLQRLLSEGGIEIASCQVCGEPWIVDRSNAQYCARPAPGHRSSCRELAAQQTYAAQHGDYSRERRRLGQQVRRERLDERAYEAWKSENSPGTRGTDWLPFDEWQAKKGSGNG